MTREPQEQIIAVVNASTHVHGRDFEVVQAAIRKVARENRRIVDPNRVRAELTGEHGLRVDPRAVGATYTALINRGTIIRHGWTTSTDRRGGNAGKPARKYRVIDSAWLNADGQPPPHQPAALPAPVPGQGELFDLTEEATA